MNNNAIVDDPQAVVDLFANFFQSTYSIPSIINPQNNTESSQNCNISIHDFTEEQVMESLKKLKPKVNQGPDQIPCFLIRDCAEIFKKPLCTIFNLALRTKTFPDVWKVGKITPILKKGDPNLVENYRPVCQVSGFSKVFEMSIYNILFQQIRNLLSPNQHGFFSSRSTITNLTCFTQFTSNALDSHKQVDTVYMDFSKAFDRVDHGILLSKLEKFGFENSTILLLSSYLKSRSQYVEIEGYQSYSFTPTSGTPQGSNLAPMLFSIFIDDIATSISSQTLLFADDVKIFKTINSITDCKSLQCDINVIEEWCEVNKLPLNVDKCKVMSFTLRKNITIFNYTIQSTDLTRCDSYKDLGIHFDQKLSFSIHVLNMTISASKILGFIYRTSKDFNNIETIKRVYYSYVRCKLEYGSIIWNPIYSIHINKIEQVQRKFAKYIMFRSDNVYPPKGIDHKELLEKTNLPLLASRRTQISLLFLFKILNNKIDCNEILGQLNFLINNTTRSTNLFYLPKSNTNIMLKSPIYSICKEYNKYSENLDMFHQTIYKYRKNLRTILEI